MIICTHEKFQESVKYSIKMDTDLDLTIFSRFCSSTILVENFELYQISFIVVLVVRCP